MSLWCRKDENHPVPSEPGFYDVILENGEEPIRYEGIAHFDGVVWDDVHYINKLSNSIVNGHFDGNGEILGIIDWKSHHSYFEENPSDLLTDRVRAAWSSVIGGNLQVVKDDPVDLYDEDIRLDMLSEIKRAVSDCIENGTESNIPHLAEAFAIVWKCSTDV